MSDKKQLLKVFTIIPVALIYLINYPLHPPIDLSVGTMISSEIMGSITSGNSKILIFLIRNQYYLFLFNILYGDYIYKNFQYSSVYLFSRLKNRKKWFLKKSIELLIISLLYTFLLLLVYLIVCSICSTKPVDYNTINIILLLFCRINLLIFLSTLIINLLSLRYSNVTSFVAVYISIVLLMSLALKQQYFLSGNIYNIFFILNPASGIIEELANSKILILLLITNLSYVATTYLIGANYIQKFDIELADYENR